MSEPIFRNSPDVELLQWLAQGSLKQNLLRAIRFWVCLRSLYGDDKTRIELPQTWTFADWRDAFFSHTHPKGEKTPLLHDPNCACAKTTADWIFAVHTGVEETEWRQMLISYHFAQREPKKSSLTLRDSEDKRESQMLHQKGELILLDGKNKKTLDEILQRRLFAVSRRSLQDDLYILSHMGWLQRQGEKYRCVNKFPALVGADSLKREMRFDPKEFAFLSPDLEDTAKNFFQPIGGFQRFFLEVDYVVHQAQDYVDDWQNNLKHLWAQIPIPTVKLTYKSAKLGYLVECIVYPVCLYYARRAIYLCAFGQTPTQKGEWYNYRLDGIQQMTTLDWSSSTVPEVLRKRYSDNLPTPDYVREEMAKVWGFDFYEPPRLLLLRFEQEFHDRYIQGTFRHDTFEKVTYQQAKQIIRQQASQQHQQSLLKVLQHRSRQDAYYHAYYRSGDINVVHRLRSWRPNTEVLLPWELRQQLGKEAATEAQLYQD